MDEGAGEGFCQTLLGDKEHTCKFINGPQADTSSGKGRDIVHRAEYSGDHTGTVGTAVSL